MSGLIKLANKRLKAVKSKMKQIRSLIDKRHDKGLDTSYLYEKLANLEQDMDDLKKGKRFLKRLHHGGQAKKPNSKTVQRK